jgi:hypothetical protein
MASYIIHKKMYISFRKDALNEDIFEGTRVEAFFLSTYHLIETCAAIFRVHINKHQHLRSILEKNPHIFGEHTQMIWQSFQQIENQIRPKFVYSNSWDDNDLINIRNLFEKVEKICLKVIDEYEKQQKN